MDPISTITLAVAMLAPAPATRKQVFDNPSEVARKECAVTSTTFLLPGPIVQPASKYSIQYGNSSVSQALSPREKLKREVDAYADLFVDWNGPHTNPASFEALHAALDVIDAIPARLPLPRPMISSSGEIGLYWDLSGGYAEVSFEPNGEISFFSRDRVGVERFEELKDLSVFNSVWFWDRIGSIDSTAREAA